MSEARNQLEAVGKIMHTEERWSEYDNKLWLEFVDEQERRDYGRGYQDGYAKGVKAGLAIKGTAVERLIK